MVDLTCCIKTKPGNSKCMDFQELFLYAFLLTLHFRFCFSGDTIAINQIFRDGDGDLLISKAKNFALGFFSPGSSRYRYLGIWYYKVPQQTVVWVANRNHPINGSSGVLSINQYGNLVLYSNNDQKVHIWSTDVSMEVTGIFVAQILDSGNLILFQDRSEKVAWKSFDYPTDTLLPGMKIGLNLKTGSHQFLTSWRSPDDPGTGNYSYRLNPKGLPQIFLYQGKTRYWRGAPWPIKDSANIRNFSFVNNQEEKSFTYFLINSSIINRVFMDYSGVAKHQIWHESEGKWKDFWSAPQSLCESYQHCGINSKCNPMQINYKFECDCLPGYETKSPKDWNILGDRSGGCIRKRLQSSSMCMNGEGFVKVAQVKFPDTSVAVWEDKNPVDCEKGCRNNCSCSAYASIDVPAKATGCLTWFGELIDVVNYQDLGFDFYVRVDAVELAGIIQQSNVFLGRKSTFAILVPSVVLTWFIIILFCYLWLKKKRKVRNKRNEKLLDMTANEVGGSTNHPEVTFFSLRTLLAATNNFSPVNIIGQGGFGLVYKMKRESRS